MVRPGSTLSSFALIGSSGSDRIVNEMSCPAFTLVMSPSAICILFNIVSRFANWIIVGVDCTAFTVWPSSTGIATTVPSIVAVMRV